MSTAQEGVKTAVTGVNPNQAALNGATDPAKKRGRQPVLVNGKTKAEAKRDAAAAVAAAKAAVKEANAKYSELTRTHESAVKQHAQTQTELAAIAEAKKREGDLKAALKAHAAAIKQAEKDKELGRKAFDLATASHAKAKEAHEAL